MLDLHYEAIRWNGIEARVATTDFTNARTCELCDISKPNLATREIWYDHTPNGLPSPHTLQLINHDDRQVEAYLSKRSSFQWNV